MTDFKNYMDKVFKDKLENYRKNPPEEIWTAINSNMAVKRERKFILPFLRVAAGLAVLIVAGTLYYFINRVEEKRIAGKTDPIQKVKIDTEPINQPKSLENIRSENKSNLDYSKRKISEIINKSISGVQKIKVVEQVSNITSIKHNPGEKIPLQNEVIKEINILAGFPFYLTPLQQVHDHIPSVSRLVDIHDMNFLSEDIPTKQSKDTWILSAQFSPTYNYRSLGNAEQKTITSYNENETGKMNYSGGILFGIIASKRLSIHSGVMFSQIGLGIKNVYSYESNEGTTYGSGSIEKSTNRVKFSKLSSSTGIIGSIKSNTTVFNSYGTDVFTSDITLSEPQIENNLNTSEKFNQYFQYIELPFILRYKVSGLKFKLNILGGMSTNLLIGNRVVLKTDDNNSVIGETLSVRTINYSGNFGVGLDYDMGKNFLLTIEPQFKYYLNSINISSLISNRPYSIGIYTGIKYAF